LTQVGTDHEALTGPVDLLRQGDNIALEMHQSQRAVIVGPAEVLIDTLADRDADNLRARLLRLDRVRSIIRLPAGSVPRRHQQSMAVWVLGATHPDVPVARRWTTITDLSDLALTAAVRIDVVNDTLAAMGNEQMVRSHAFHYSRRVLARSVIAADGPLIPGPTAPAPRVPDTGSHTAAHLTALAERLDREEPSPLSPALTVHHAPPPANRQPADRDTIEHWLQAREIELISGHRLAIDASSDSGI